MRDRARELLSRNDDLRLVERLDIRVCICRRIRTRVRVCLGIAVRIGVRIAFCRGVWAKVMLAFVQKQIAAEGHGRAERDDENAAKHPAKPTRASPLHAAMMADPRAAVMTIGNGETGAIRGGRPGLRS
jgi:hypothetical protein